MDDKFIVSWPTKRPRDLVCERACMSSTALELESKNKFYASSSPLEDILFAAFSKAVS